MTLPEVVNVLLGSVINGIEFIAQEKGYHVLNYLTHENMQKKNRYHLPPPKWQG